MMALRYDGRASRGMPASTVGPFTEGLALQPKAGRPQEAPLAAERRRPREAAYNAFWPMSRRYCMPSKRMRETPLYARAIAS